MILKCSHCGGMMRVDDSVPASGRRVKVRCPHCREIDYLEPPFPQDVSREALDVPQGVSSNEAGGVRPSEQRPVAEARPPGPTVAAERTAESSPGGFRFPAENTAKVPREKPRRSSRVRLILWVVSSIAVVAFFALLVNLILPGPYAGKPLPGVPSTGSDLSSGPPEARPSPKGRGAVAPPQQR